MEQLDTIQDQVSEIEELNMHAEIQTKKIIELEKDIKDLLENKEFFAKAQKELNESKYPIDSPKSSCLASQRSIFMNLQEDLSFLNKGIKELEVDN